MCHIGVDAAVLPHVLINEVLIDHMGVDNNEYIELNGPPLAELQGLSLIVVEGDQGARQGNIDVRFDFQAIHRLGKNGYFLLGNCAGLKRNFKRSADKPLGNNTLENSSLTIALVDTAELTGKRVTDLQRAISAIAFSDGGVQDQFYFNATVLTTPTGMPAGANRLNRREDNKNGAQWRLLPRRLGELNTPQGGDLNGCIPRALSIAEIQGAGHTSPYSGEWVKTRGVVTQVSQNAKVFWLQTLGVAHDGQRSNGIAVFPDHRMIPAPVIGDVITLAATVEELQFGQALPLTRLTQVQSFLYEAHGQVLPAAQVISRLPDVSMSQAKDYWESLEGMRVVVADSIVVAPTNDSGEFVMITAANSVNNPAYLAAYHQLVLRKLDHAQVDYNPERILVAVAANSELYGVLPGQHLQNISGIVDYRFGRYKIQLQSYQAKEVKLEPKPLETAQVSHNGEDLRLVTFNLNNLFDTQDDPEKNDTGSTPTPAAFEIKMHKLSLALIHEMNLPDIVVVQEVEHAALLQLWANRVNLQRGTRYQGKSLNASDKRGIENGFLWNANRLNLNQLFLMSGPLVQAAFSQPQAGREPLVGIFEFQGKKIQIIANHFRSRRGDDPLFGVRWPPFRASESVRVKQAYAVRDYLNHLFQREPTAAVVVAGDLNSFPFGESGQEQHPVQILLGNAAEVKLYNAVVEYLGVQAFSYVFEGNSQLLDHILLSSSLAAKVEQVKIYHFNAGFPHFLAHEAAIATRVSDHDPVEVRLKMQ